LPEALNKINVSNVRGELLLFWLIFLFLSFAFIGGRITLRAAPKKERKSKKPKYEALKGMLYGFFGAGLFMCFSMVLMAPDFINNLSLLAQYLFTGTIAQIGWAIAPLIVLMLFR